MSFLSRFTRFLPSREVLAGGLTGLVTFAVVAGLNVAGVSVPSEVVAGVLAVALPYAARIVPKDAREEIARLDAQLRGLAG